MKKLISILLVILLMLTSCSVVDVKNESNIQKSESETKENKESAVENVVDYSKYLVDSNHGEGEGSEEYVIKDFSDYSSKDDNLLIYKNPYPTGYTGAKYEVNQALVDSEIELLKDFLKLCYDDYSEEKYPITVHTPDDNLDNRYVTYKTDNIEIFSRLGSLNFAINNDGITLDNILENKVVLSALALIGVKNPQIVQKRVLLKADHSTSSNCAVVIEKSTDENDMINKVNFHCLTVEMSIGSKVFLKTINIDLNDVKLDVQKISVDEILNYFKKNHNNEGNVFSTITYIPTINYNYYVPCCKIFYDTGDKDSQGNTIYQYQLYKLYNVENNFYD